VSGDASGAVAGERDLTAERDAAPFSRGAFFALALRVGVFAFGGGFAIIANIKQRVVDERRWMDAEEFAQAIGVVAALPGTNAANLITIVGARLGGPTTGAVGCALFLVPGLAMMTAFGVFYERLRGLPGFGGVLEGITAAAVGIVAAVADELRPTIVTKRREALLVALVFGALAAHVLSLLEVVAIAGVIGMFASRWPPRGAGAAAILLGAAKGGSLAGLTLAASEFAAFAKIAIGTFGGGISMLPAVEREIASHGWLPATTFADAVAFAQITPGPIAKCATFLGYRVAGFGGAAAATLGVFLPPLVLALVVAQRLADVRESANVRGFLHGVSIAVVGAIAAAAYSVYRAGVHGVALTLFCVVVFAWRRSRPRASTILAIAGGAAFGLARSLLVR
jgi:chromate transporter